LTASPAARRIAGVHRQAKVEGETSAPVLLLFTLGARRESARRRLLPARLHEQETQFRDALAERVAGIAAGAGCELVISSPERPALEGQWIRQRGEGFGERLAASIEAVELSDGRPLVVVGSDTPGMSARHVSAALVALRDDPDAVVVGPAPDGGMYLIASAAPLGSLEGVRWCTRHARDDFFAALRSAGRTIVFLEALGDLDTARDLARWLSQRVVDSRALLHLSQLLRSLLRELTFAIEGLSLQSPVVASLAAAVRPPPAAA
jgi:2-phospho-L-lactate guanylyltransferase (CobY/MobA/RfbA family)